MKYKIGGGGWYQLYDPKNGQYTDEDKAEALQKDPEALKLFLKHRAIVPGREPAFPVDCIHDNQYKIDFVIAYRNQFNNPTIEKSKTEWLFVYHEGHDRSKFLLNTVGYSIYEKSLFMNHVIENTDFKTIKYSRIEKGKYFKCKALTTLKNGVKATTIWEVKPENLSLTFVTIIPDRDTYDKD